MRSAVSRLGFGCHHLAWLAAAASLVVTSLVVSGAARATDAAADAVVVSSPAPSKAETSPAREPATPIAAPAPSFRAIIRAIVEREAQKAGLPADIAMAVMRVESNFDPALIGSVGEIGLMQVRPETAALMGFKGSLQELATPEVNIHYGVTYLAKAWRLADGDLCRALMKYRAGHGEESMTARSVSYCSRAESYLVSPDTPPSGTEPAVTATARTAAAATARAVKGTTAPISALASPKAVYAQYKQGTAAASRAFWAAHEARVKAIDAKLQAGWRRVASR